MALQLKKNKFRLSTAATGALVLGAGYIILKTFPHLKTSLLSRLYGDTTEEEDENEIVQLNEDEEIATEETTESLILEKKIPADTLKWSDATLRSYLTEVSIPHHSQSLIEVSTVREKKSKNIEFFSILLHIVKRLQFHVYF
ncbi:hypothetical protein HF325_006694 [Metschnikowia pulcherrima]|uniref:Uncharacterized protein n=1 Tax=Metschnikowia pulcherrima TaxID=27326 RepID=A0A8H7GLG6_9ASCO|nr:hypothetical protein HF325_006694 [Metschnikowia pulcherrima]